MKQKKRKRATISILGDQYDALLIVATEQQKQKKKSVTVGMLIREMIDIELGIERETNEEQACNIQRKKTTWACHGSAAV